MIRSAEVRAKRVRTVAGLMTGTSMDGLDIAVCRVTSAPELGVALQAFETVPLPRIVPAVNARVWVMCAIRSRKEKCMPVPASGSPASRSFR